MRHWTSGFRKSWSELFSCLRKGMNFGDLERLSFFLIMRQNPAISGNLRVKLCDTNNMNYRIFISPFVFITLTKNEFIAVENVIVVLWLCLHFWL